MIVNDPKIIRDMELLSIRHTIEIFPIDLWIWCETTTKLEKVLVRLQSLRSLLFVV